MENQFKIGNTPLVELKGLEKYFHLKQKIWVKLENTNETGSIKDRPALHILRCAEKEGKLLPNMKIVEASSGNMGISLSMIGKKLGYEVYIVMPDSMTIERREMIQKYGGKLILTPGEKGMKGSVEYVENWAKKEMIFIPSQFENIKNKEAHYIGTGKEIIDDLHGNIDVFCASFGSGGTISGIGKRLKEYRSSIQVVAIEPEESPLLSKGYAHAHKIQGIGANFIPSILDKEVIDEVILASGEKSIQMAKLIQQLDGYAVGISSGANVLGVLQMIEKYPNYTNFVTVFPDDAYRYLEVFQ